MPRDDSYDPRRERMFNAPPLVLGVAILLVALHGLTYLLTNVGYERLAYDYALAPQRFWAPAGSPDAYPNPAAAALTLFTTALLHTGWLHVLVNSGMLLAFGAQAARVLGPGWRGAGLWVLMLAVSVVAGSAVYLASNPTIDAPAAVGASGGVCGLIGAAFLVGVDGQGRSLLSRRFLMTSFAFALANALLALGGPAIVGSGIAWQAHLGGYLAGALMMAVLRRGEAPADIG